MAVRKETRTLETAEPFASLFPVDATTLALVSASIKEHGFDANHPILTWRDAFGEKGRTVVVDGHTRLKAALDLKLPDVWVTVRQFKDVDAAITAGIGEQVNRRNLNREQIAAYVVKLLPLLDQRKGGLRTRTAKQLAQLLGVSVPTVDRARGLIASGRADLVAAVLDGEMSLLSAYTETTGGEPPRGTATITPPPAPSMRTASVPNGVSMGEQDAYDLKGYEAELNAAILDEAPAPEAAPFTEAVRRIANDPGHWLGAIHLPLDEIDAAAADLRFAALGATVNANGHKGQFKIAQIQFHSSGAVYALNRAGKSIDLRDVTKVIEPSSETKRVIEGS